MIYQLMKRDPAWKAVLLMALAGAFVLPVVIANRDPAASGAAFHIADPIFLMFFFIVGTTWIPSQQRDTRFQTGLPISVRDILWARTFSLSMLLCVPLAAAAAAAFIFRGSAHWEWSGALLELAALYPPMVLLMEFVAIHESRFGNHRILVALFNGICIACPIAALDLDKTTILAVWSLLTIVLVMAVWRAIPNVLEVAPEQTPSTTAPTKDLPADANDDLWTARAIGWLPVLRSLFPLLICLPVLFYMVLSSARFSSWATLCFGVWFSATLPRAGSRWLSAFPLSRRVFLTAIVTPILLIATAAYLTGGGEYAGVYPSEIWTIPSQSWPPVTPGPQCERLNVIPPLEFWRPARGGKAPLIESPWGESFQPPVISVMKQRVYNPYAVGCQNSERFLDWQFARATTAGYGRSISRSEYQGPGHWVPPPVTPPLRMQVFHVAAFLGLALFVVLLTGLDDWYRFGRLSRPVRRIVWSLLVVVPIGGIIGIDLLSPNVHITSSMLVEDALQWISWLLPDNLTITIVTAAMPLIALIWAIDKLFRESEFVGKPEQTA